MTNDDIMTLAGEFPPVTQEQWLAAVDKVLAGRPFAKVLQSVTADGIEIDPLYLDTGTTADGQFPIGGTGRRASNVAGSLNGWDVRQHHALADDVVGTNEAILLDLDRGVTSIELDLGRSGGVNEALLRRTLDGVFLDLAPIALRSPGSGVNQAQALLAVATSQDVTGTALTADLGCNPIGNLAADGHVGQPIDVALDDLAAFSALVAGTHPNVRSIRADATAVAEAGGSPALELAVTVASGVQYLRALTDAGLDVGAALGQMLLSVTVGTDQFGDIAKLRALRVLWARVAEAVGAPDHRAAVQAGTANLVLTERDPWVNMLRTTIGCFAAAVGGADIVTIAPFDAPAGRPDQLGLRIARNTQLALMEESHLHRVIDPAGGSWYVEELTDRIADAAWAVFQDIERSGGIIASLQAGEVQRQVAQQWEVISAQVSTRRRTIVGVSEFPNLDERGVERAPWPADTSAASPDADHRVDRLVPRRLAGGFERLREAAQHHAVENDAPTVFLANLGPIAVHTARAAWATNFFEAGGIRALSTDGFEDDESMVAAFKASGSALAVLCSSDGVYANRAESAAAALRASGAKRVYMAGNPGDARETFESAGVQEFVHVGSDVLAILEQAHQLLGIDPNGGRQ